MNVTANHVAMVILLNAALAALIGGGVGNALGVRADLAAAVGGITSAALAGLWVVLQKIYKVKRERVFDSLPVVQPAQEPVPVMSVKVLEAPGAVMVNLEVYNWIGGTTEWISVYPLTVYDQPQDGPEVVIDSETILRRLTGPGAAGNDDA